MNGGAFSSNFRNTRLLQCLHDKRAAFAWSVLVTNRRFLLVDFRRDEPETEASAKRDVSVESLMCSISAKSVNRFGSLYSRLAIIHTVYKRPTGRTQLKRLLILSVLRGTTSIDHEYRFFDFLFACTLYNVWRLVDLLVKLESLAGSEFRYNPLATADLFLAIANGNAGPDPLD